MITRQTPLPILLSTTLLTAIAAAQSQPAGTALLAQQPSRFLANEGQWPSPELYRLRAGGMQLFFEPTGWSFWLPERLLTDESAGAVRESRSGPPAAPIGNRRLAVRMQFVGAAAPQLVPEQPLAGTSHYLVGDAGRHREDVAGYGAVLYRGMYPGVDVRVREAAGVCEYDLLLRPDADLGQVRLRVDGVDQLSIDETGALVLCTALGNVRQPAPTTWSEAKDGTRRTVRCHYVLHGDGSFGFAAPERDPALALVVDPPLIWSSYVGGSALDEPRQVLEDGTGKVFVVGYTESFDFPTTPGVVQTQLQGTGDGFVMLLDPSQPPASQVVFSTFFGGSGQDVVSGIAVTNGMIAFCGTTNSSDLPTPAGAYQPANAGGDDAFLGVLDPTGTVLLNVTYFGGSANDGGYTSLQAAANGNLYVAGYTASANLPTTANAYDLTLSGASDGFVAVFAPLATTLLYSTFIGGSGDDKLWMGGLDANGVVSLLGSTTSRAGVRDEHEAFAGRVEHAERGGRRARPQLATGAAFARQLEHLDVVAAAGPVVAPTVEQEAAVGAPGEGDPGVPRELGGVHEALRRERLDP